jgi:aryl-alcohol dehydrogenase-like predicted oxidoreductase
MKTRCFGASDICTSVIGFGTWPIGGARYGPSDDQDAIRAIRCALDAGITCFDTAPSYGGGHAEGVLGQALAGRRVDAFVVTKGGMLWDEQAFIVGLDSSREYLEQGLEASLRRLGMDHVDLFLLHWPDETTPLEEIAHSLESLVASGKTRSIGVCNLRERQLRRVSEASTTSPIVASQVGFSLFDRRWADETFAASRDLGIGVMAYGPLAHGLLTGVITRESAFEPSDWRASGVFFGQPLLTEENRERNFAVIDRLAAFARDRSISLAQLATAWVLAHDIVTVALVGARNEQEIGEEAGAATIELTADDMRAIEEIMTAAAGMTDVLPAGGTSRATRQHGSN